MYMRVRVCVCQREEVGESGGEIWEVGENEGERGGKKEERENELVIERMRESKSSRIGLKRCDAQ